MTPPQQTQTIDLTGGPADPTANPAVATITRKPSRIPKSLNSGSGFMAVTEKGEVHFRHWSDFGSLTNLSILLPGFQSENGGDVIMDGDIRSFAIRKVDIMFDNGNRALVALAKPVDLRLQVIIHEISVDLTDEGRAASFLKLNEANGLTSNQALSILHTSHLDIRTELGESILHVKFEDANHLIVVIGRCDEVLTCSTISSWVATEVTDVDGDNPGSVQRSWAMSASTTINSTFVIALNIIPYMEFNTPSAVLFGFSSGVIEARNAWTLEPMSLPSINFRNVGALVRGPVDNVQIENEPIFDLVVSACRMEIFAPRRVAGDGELVLKRVGVFEGVTAAIGFSESDITDLVLSLARRLVIAMLSDHSTADIVASMKSISQFSNTADFVERVIDQTFSLFAATTGTTRDAFQGTSAWNEAIDFRSCLQLQLEIFRNAPGKEQQYKNTYIMAQLQVVSDIFIHALELPWGAYDIISHLTEQAEINDTLLNKTGTLIFRKETLHYLVVIAAWVTELCASLMRQLYAFFYGRRNWKGAEGGLIDPNVLQAFPNSRLLQRPNANRLFIVFHQPTRLTLQRLCILTRYLRLNLGMHGKNVIDGLVRGNVSYEKFHLGVQDGALQRVRIKIDAMSNFLRAMGQAVDPVSDRAGSRMEDLKKLGIWGTVPEHLLTVLPGVKGLYEGALVKVFTPLAPSG
ncbi:hypothetical protein HK097_007391, partial [Rhizophlyctis rosea]